MTEPNPAFLAPCGLYCGVCAVYYATRDKNPKLKERLGGVYKGSLPGSDELTPEDMHCKGCLSEEPLLFCSTCAIKDCTREKGIQGCHQCEIFPCEQIENFPMPVGKRVILRAIPHWRAVGTRKWVEDEEAHYYCPECGHKLFRGAKRCNRCLTPVDLDG